MSEPEMKWEPFTLSAGEQAYMRAQEEQYQRLISMFALTQAQIGVAHNSNRPYAESQGAAYRERYFRDGCKK